MAFFAALISAGFFFFLPHRTWVSVRFYGLLYPDRSVWYLLYCTWRQYQSFARVFSERLELRNEDRITYTSKGWEHLEEAAANGSGGVILMSHAGSWEVAARLFRRNKLRMMLYMGVKNKEQVERLQKADLLAEDLKIVATPEGESSPMEMLEGLRFLKEGGFVSMAGDRVWNPHRIVPVSFLGKTAQLPDTPYLLAALSKTPLFIFYSFRTAPRKYHIQVSKPLLISPASRRERPAAVQACAGEYGRSLEEAVRSHPAQWYHFDRFTQD
jgi:lauroyl/myristoyl acyltransferase